MRSPVLAIVTAFGAVYIVLLSFLPQWVCFATLIVCPILMIVLFWLADRKPPDEVDAYCARVDDELDGIRAGGGFRS